MAVRRKKSETDIRVVLGGIVILVAIATLAFSFTQKPDLVEAQSSGEEVDVYPSETKEFPVYWVSWGSGAGARAFRKCDTIGNVSTTATGVATPEGLSFKETSLSGNARVPAISGFTYRFSTTCGSSIVDAKTSDLSFSVQRKLRVDIAPENRSEFIPLPVTPLPQPTYQER